MSMAKTRINHKVKTSIKKYVLLERKIILITMGSTINLVSSKHRNAHITTD